jgi:uncharacterized CHY-type Zn-finger protein
MGGVLITCRVCKNKIPMNNMRYEDNGEDLICNDCYNKRHGTYVAPKINVAEKKVVLNKPAESTHKLDVDFEKQDGDRVTYVCEKCKYKFKRKEGFPVNQCPYCGSTYLKPI